MVTWKLLEILGKAVSVERLGMKTRLARVEEKMVGEVVKTANLDKSFKEFCFTSGSKKGGRIWREAGSQRRICVGFKTGGRFACCLK